MCTLTFVPYGQGYLAGMNRDELLSRPRALPPALSHGPRFSALYPREPSGGTWIGCNALGNLLALLNWNDVNKAGARPQTASRGIVIPELIFEADSSGTSRKISSFNLAGIYPFRLVGVFPDEQFVCEWRWDGTLLQSAKLPWKRRHWFSSRVSDVEAEQVRGRTCEAVAAATAGETSRDWLATLHRSHEPERGAFSVCVHREDAATASYTEIHCDANVVSISYVDGPPCGTHDSDLIVGLGLPLAGPPRAAARTLAAIS